MHPRERSPLPRWLARAGALVKVPSPARAFDLAALVVMAAVTCIMLYTVADYGLTYDEEPHLRLGDRVIAFYENGLQASSRLKSAAYGAGFDLLSALMRRVSPWGPFHTNHIACIFVAQVGLLGTWKLGRLLGGPAAGALALSFLILTPVYYGHQFNNPKDIPFAAGYVWGLYALARLSRGLSTENALAARPRLWAGLAIALALGMSVRLGGAVLIGYLVFILAGHALDAWRLRGGRAALDLRPVLARAALAVAVSWALMTVFWPRALRDPVGAPVAAIETVTRFKSYDSPTLLAGRKIPSQDVPWHYLPTYFAGQLPELVSACALGGIVALAIATGGRYRQRKPLPWAEWALVLSVLLPPAYAILRGSTLYNGLRHFLFLVPPLCVLAALWATRLLARAWVRRRAVFLAGTAVLLAFTVDQVSTSVRLHPHQHVYFNRVFGGVRSAVGRYETEYYGSVYRELLDELNEHLWRERRADYLVRPFRVTGCGSKLFFTQNLPLNFQYQALRQRKPADYFASYVRDECLKRFRDRAPVLRVEREGAVLAIVRDLRRRR